MDLSTLSSLLQDHTAELTSLYGQLGASSDTVPAKLEELHAALVGTVKQQKDAAVAELAEVRERVHGLRLTLERKRRRLGEGRTSTGGSESETLLQLRERLEKEDVTTERIVQAREKLFMDARKRLEAFVDALGAEVVHGMGSNGINSRSPSSNSEGVSTVSAEEDLSLERLNALEKSVSRCHAEVQQRQALLSAIVHEIFELWGELGLSPTSASTSACPDEGGSSSADDHQLDLAILHTLELALPTGLASSSVKASGSPLTVQKSTLAALQTKKLRLEELREVRMAEIQQLYDELYLLWTRLGVTDEEADDFVELWKGCEPRCIAAYRAELDRMLQIKADNMVIFIAREREDIMALWDALFYADEQRTQFTLFESDMATEEILLAHEMEKHRLLEEKATKEPVLIRLDKYFELLDEMSQLEASANDPARLTGKGQRGDPGRLLREEKLRKRVAVQKPKLEKDLMKLIPEWEQSCNQPFLVHGSRFVEDLAARLDRDQGGKAIGKQRPKALASSTSSASLNPTAPSLKRQMTGTAQASSSLSRSIASAGPPTTVKRARTNTITSSTSTSNSTMHRVPAPYQRPMHTGASVMSTCSSLMGVPATPCPPPAMQAHAASSMQPGGQPATSTPAVDGIPRMDAFSNLERQPASRLPLKTNYISMINGAGNSSAYSGIGLKRPPLTGPTPSSLFSPQALSSMQQQQQPVTKAGGRPSFRPRPSLASVGTATSSFASSSSWGLRTVSSATSVDSRC